MMHLKDSTIILTGASMGIGRAVAGELARSGVNLVINARHAEPLRQVAAECEERGVKVWPVVGDAADAQTAAQMVTIAAEHDFSGFLQVAGVLHPGPLLWELSAEQFREVFTASVTASHQLIRFAVPALLARGAGLAVFLGSGAAESNTPGLGAYCSAKAAEEHLTRQLAAEAPTITTFVYRPGVVETRMQQNARESSGGAAATVREKFLGFKERGELISPERTARALVHILTNDPRRFHGKTATWRDGLQ